MIHYFTYGSNLHPIRLTERVPSANLLGSTRLNGHRLEFQKKGVDGSGKCNLLVTGTQSEKVFGAIYAMAAEHKYILDKFESREAGYIDKQISVQFEDRELECFTYFAQQSYIFDGLSPYHWYKQLVVEGAAYLDFPQPYISSIQAVESTEDPNDDRRKVNEVLLQKVRSYPR